LSDLHKFIFEGLPVRGMLVRLTDSWQELLVRRAERPFPQPVRELLGEMAAASVLMQGSIKFNGSLILQVFGDGPVKLAVAEAQADLSFRATATVVGEVAADARLEAMLNVHGQGRCSITLDPKDKLPGQTPYQGIVPLHGYHREPLQKISDVLEHYMLQSEQLDTRLILASDDKVAAGLLIQRLPSQEPRNTEGTYSRADEDEIGINEDYNRIAHLASTLTRDELLSLDADTLLRRLFWEETIRRFEPQQPAFACTCSRERVSNMLKSLGQAEVDSIIAEQGQVEIGCEFCGRRYHYDAIDAAELFMQGRNQPPGTATVQ
jgi:molecular chaperone Hsp33